MRGSYYFGVNSKNETEPRSFCLEDVCRTISREENGKLQVGVCAFLQAR